MQMQSALEESRSRVYIYQQPQSIQHLCASEELHQGMLLLHTHIATTVCGRAGALSELNRTIFSRCGEC